ncbi:hypothetical protein ACLOJK_035560 [Asimina triloba]
MQGRCVLLVAVILLCLITDTAQGRSVANGADMPSLAGNKNNFETSSFHPPPTEEVEVPDAVELVTVDYTPAKKNPPIHH